MNEDKNNNRNRNDLEVDSNGSRNDGKGRVLDESIELKKNAMLSHRSELFYEWDFEKNDELGLDVYRITKASTKEVWWVCPDCESNYDMFVDYRISKNSNCPYCRGYRVNHTNSLASLRPDIAKEWHPTKNGDLTPHDVTCGRAKRVWWACLDCTSDYNSLVSHRTREKSTGCPYCSGRKVNHTNSLAALKPTLAKEWHPTKNKRKTPCQVTVGSNENIWWLGECGHEWKTMINSRVGREQGCPYCANVMLLQGFNDMWTANPEMAKQLLNPEDGYKYMQSSSGRVDWKCLECKNTIKNKKINNVFNGGLSCPKCSDNVSFGEKVIFNLLKNSEIDFYYDANQSWSKGRRYDFYFLLNTEKYIIETHGKQHYVESRRGRTLKEEQENDKLKEQLAKENGIDKYIVIDCRFSTLEWVRNSVENGKLKEIIDLDSVDWKEIGRQSEKSFVKEACDLWVGGLRSTLEISKTLKISSNTTVNYLKRGAKIGWCDYYPVKGSEYTKRKIVKLSLEREKVDEYESISSAKELNGYSNDNGIVRNCQGRTSSYNGFEWMYKEDYDRYLETGDAAKQYSPKRKVEKSVVKLSRDMVFLEVYESSVKAAKENNIKSSSHIPRACRETHRTSGGYKWMYKEDYDKMITQ